MLDVAEAQRIVLEHVQPLPAVELTLRDALYRTLAAPIRADLDDPPFDKSVMDGYAVRSADVANAPVTLAVVGQIGAGRQSDRTLRPGEAIQINTGAPIPPGADAVVRLEGTEPAATESQVVVKEHAGPGKFITPRAAHARAGQTILQAGDWLTPTHIGVAATAGAARVSVHRQPRVAILTTGDELVGIDERPSGAQIRNSNQYLLEALARSAHAEPWVLDPVGDNRSALAAAIRSALGTDILCITGGVSVGAFDFVPEVLRELGATVHVHRMAIKPGRPTLFATASAGTLVFALPGNPVSAFVGFALLVRPALARLEGRRSVVPRPIRARLIGKLPATTDRRSFFPASVMVTEGGEWTVETLSWHGSGDSLGMAGANAMVELAPRSPAVHDGENVSVYLLDRNG